MTKIQAEQKINAKVHRNFVDRALEMFRHVTNGITTISKLRISKNWPAYGKITFIRDADAKHFEMIVCDKKFIARPK